ncbi:MAG: M28 family peptidase [Deltaproteobacteria bacterium]|nr:M28 family peptidase [Deltaproteobacteria bacterium]
MKRSVAVLGLAGCIACSGGSNSSSSSSGGGGSSSSSSSSSSGGSSGTPDAGPPVPSFMTEAELQRLTTDLASDSMDGRDEGTAGSQAARTYIKDLMGQCRLQEAGTTGFEQAIGSSPGINLLGRIAGTDSALASRHIIVSAHYDHLGDCGGAVCNGANDNAAAVAILMAVACEVSRAAPKRSVLIAAWDAEEPPTFLSNDMGSEYYAGHPLVPLADTDVAIAMDLVGGDLWPGYAGHFVLGAESSSEVNAAAAALDIPAGLGARRGGLHLVEQTRNGMQPWSDYDAFRNRGVPVVFLSNGQNKMYHTPSDEASTLSYDRMALEAQLLLALVRALGDATTTPQFDAQGRDDRTDAETIHGVMSDALATGGIVDALSLTTDTRNLLQQDLADVTAVKSVADTGTALTSTQRSTLRRATQRIMCLASPDYTEQTCRLL